MRGPVWAPLPQTSAAAEYVACSVAHQAAAAESEYVGDNMSVIKSFEAGTEAARKGARTYDGVMLSRHLDLERSLVRKHRWTKAHRDLSTLEGKEKEDALGNAMVDEMAGKAE